MERNPTAESAPAQVRSAEDGTLRSLRYGSLAVLGGYTVALCFHVGLFRKVLPRHVNAKLERVVERVKAKTEPIGNVKRFALARSHLLKAYGWAASGMAAAVAGVALFAARPRIPIALPLALTVVSSVSLALPKSVVIHAGRVLCFYTASLSAGYCFGPIAWVAQDTLVLVLLLTGCTVTGLCLPLFLTRGMVSYVMSSQLLSLAMSLALVTAPKQSNARSPFRHLKAQPGVQGILDGDVNVLLTMQLLANLTINALHTVPVIYRFVSSTDTDDELTRKADPLREAFCICAGWGYASFRVAQCCMRRLIRRVLKESRQAAHRGSDGFWVIEASANPSGEHRGNGVNVASSITAGLVSALLYVRVVSLLQKSDCEALMNEARKVCQRTSPIALLLGRRGN